MSEIDRAVEDLLEDVASVLVDLSVGLSFDVAPIINIDGDGRATVTVRLDISDHLRLPEREDNDAAS